MQLWRVLVAAAAGVLAADVPDLHAAGQAEAERGQLREDLLKLALLLRGGGFSPGSCWWGWCRGI